MTKYREIIRLTGLGFSQRDIMASCGVAQKTVVKVQKRARELKLSWPLDEAMTDTELQKLMFSKENKVSPNKRMPDYDYIRKELLRNGVSKKLLWTEYMEDCRANGEEPLMYSQFCYHIQQDEQKHRATMHINRKPGEQVEVDWAGDPATIIDPDTGEIMKAYIFVGVMTYSQYTYVEAFLDMKQKSWINAHVHMYEYFGGVARILVPDNCKTAVVHNVECQVKMNTFLLDIPQATFTSSQAIATMIHTGTKSTFPINFKINIHFSFLSVPLQTAACRD